MPLNRGGFSWKRADGITRAKRRISRVTGTPVSRSGRQQKIGRMMTGGCCLLPILFVLSLPLAVAALAIFILL